MSHPEPSIDTPRNPPAPRPRPRQAPDRLTSALATATVQPGQTLVLAVSDNTVTPEQVQRLRGQVAARLPGVEIVIVGGVAQMAVYDPAGQPA